MIPRHGGLTTPSFGSDFSFDPSVLFGWLLFWFCTDGAAGKEGAAGEGEEAGAEGEAEEVEAAEAAEAAEEVVRAVKEATVKRLWRKTVLQFWYKPIFGA